MPYQEPKPEWEERFDNEFPSGIYEKEFVKPFIRSAIQEAVEEERVRGAFTTNAITQAVLEGERRRIAEAVEKIRLGFEPPYQGQKDEVMERYWKYQVETLNEVIAIINPKK